MALTWVLLVALTLAGVVVSRPDFTGGAGHHHGHHHHHHDQHHPEHHHDDHHQQHHHDHTTSEVSSEDPYPLPEPSSDASANAEILPPKSPEEPSGYAYPLPTHSFDPSGYGALNPPEPSDEQSDYAYPIPHHSLDASASADLHVPETFEARDQSSSESSAEVSGYAYPVPEHSFDASGSDSLSPPQESDELLGYAYPVPTHSFDASAGADLSPPEESDEQLGYAYPVPAHSFDASGGADLSPPEVPDASSGYYLPVTAHSSEESEEDEHTAQPVRHPYGYSYPVPASAFSVEVNGHHSGSSSRKGSSLSREHQSTGTSHDSRQRAPGTSSAISISSTSNNDVPALTQSVKEQLKETVQTVHGIDFTASEDVGQAHTSIPELRGVGSGHRVIQAPSSKVKLFPRLHSSTNSKPGSVFFNPNLPAYQHKETHGGSSTTDNASVKSATLSAFRGSRGHGDSKAQKKEEEAEAVERQVKSSSTSLLDKDFNPLSHFQIRTHSFQPSAATRRLAQRINKHPKETRVEERENKAKVEEKEDNAKAEEEEDEEAQVSNVRHFSSSPSLSRKYGPARSGDSEVSTLSLFVKHEEEHEEEEEEGEGAEENEEEESEESSEEEDEYEVRHPLFIILGSHKNGNSNRRAYGYPSHGAQDEDSEYGRTLFLPYISGDEDDSEDPLGNLRLPLSVVPGLDTFHDLQLTKLNDQLTGYVTDLDHSKTAEFIHLLTQHVEEGDDSSSSEESSEEEEEEEEEEGGGEEEDKEENGGEDGGHNGNEEGIKAISYQYGTPTSHRTGNIPNHFRVSTSNSPSNIPLAPRTHPRETRRQDASEVSSQTTSGNHQQPKIEEQSQQAVTATSRRQPFSRTFRRSQLGQIVINEAPQAEKSGSQRVERIRTSSRGFDSENIGKSAITEVPNKLHSIKGHPGSADTISHLSVGQPVSVL